MPWQKEEEKEGQLEGKIKDPGEESNPGKDNHPERDIRKGRDSFQENRKKKSG
jgi:hypothetical protein